MSPDLADVLGATSPALLAALASGLLRRAASLRHLHRSPELQGWIRHRLELLGEEACLPPCLADVRALAPRGIPFPLVDEEGQEGAIGFVDVTGRRGETLPGEGAAADLRAACEAATTWFQSLDPHVAALEVVLDLPAPAAGRSAGLAALLAALLHHLGHPRALPFAATGCWNRERGGLQSARQSSLPAKLRLLVGAGYPRVFLVDEPGIRPLAARVKGLVPLFVSPRPAKALVDILLQLPLHAEAAARSVQDLLLLLDRRYVRQLSGGAARTGELEGFLSRMAEARDHWTRVLALDLRSRLYLHTGQSVQADVDTHAVQAALAKRRDAFNPKLRRAFGGEWLAHRGVVAIDAGLWDPQLEIWQRLDEAIRQHRQEIRQALIPPLEKELALLALLNTRARVREYRARIQEKPEELEKVLADRLSLRQRWPAIMRYAQEERRLDTTLERQENQILDTLGALFELTGRWPEELEERCHVTWSFLEHEPRPWPRPGTHLNPFDCLARVRYRLARPDSDPGFQQRLLAWIKQLAQSEMVVDHPLTRILDLAILEDPGGPLGRLAADLLMQVPWIAKPPRDPPDIRTLVALRSRAAIARVRHISPQPFFEELEASLKPGPLKSLLQHLLESDPSPKRLLARSPY